MDASIFRTVAIGHVAENKALMSKTVLVTPSEWMTMRDGELTSSPTSMTYKTVDQDGVEDQGGMLTDNTILATWHPASSNRLTAPDVRRGERVEILQAADDDKYYWRPMGLDDHLRKLETIIVGISATQDEGATELKPENMYWIEFSSHSKKVALSTSKANGEPFLYEFFFDTATGTVTLKDDIGNFIFMNSKEKLLHLQNAMGAFLKLSLKDILMFAPQDIMADATRDASITAGRDFSVKAGRKATIDGGGSVQVWEASQTSLKTPKFVGSK